MELKLKTVEIKDLNITDKKSYISNNILYINKKEIEDLILEDKRIKKVSLHIANPGESIRILPVKDVIEPRSKEEGQSFPGVIGKFENSGSGISYRLKNVCVVTTGPIVSFQEGLIDMKGPLTNYTPFSKTHNIVLDITKNDDINPHEHEEVIRFAGIKAASYIGDLAKSVKEDYTKTLLFNKITKRKNSLPKIAYICLCMSQGLLHDSYIYGRDSKETSPLIINPLEFIDGAIVSGNCVSPGSKTTTFHHQNNAVIKELLDNDGKRIDFVATVISPLMMTLKDKYRNSQLTSNIINMLNVDGVIISQEGFGNPTTDIMILCKKLEQNNIKTVLISNEDAGTDGFSEPLPDGTVEANAMISTGNSNATIELPKMDKVIGNIKSIEKITGGFVGSIKEDGSIIVEIHSIMGSHNLQGYSNLSAKSI